MCFDFLKVLLLVVLLAFWKMAKMEGENPGILVKTQLKLLRWTARGGNHPHRGTLKHPFRTGPRAQEAECCLHQSGSAGGALISAFGPKHPVIQPKQNC